MIDTKALRQKILDLAMRGKLVPQDPNDEPVENLLARIKEERHRLEKEKKISKVIDSDIFWSDDDNCYYGKDEIPNGWSCLQLQYFSKIFTGNSLNDSQKLKFSVKVDDTFCYVSTKDIDLNGNVNYENGIYTPIDEKLKIAKAKSILICLEGANAGNKIAIIDKNINFVNKLACVETFSVIEKFIYYFFCSSVFNEEFRSNLQGIIGGVPLSKFKELSILIPPLQEQQRIVAKLDDLFALIDKIEKEQDELEEYKKLAKEKVLELAVTGKLVKQDPNDEPASELLERIKKEKEALIKAGKIKKDKADSEPLSDDDKNYYQNLPNGWCFARLSDLALYKKGPFGSSLTKDMFVDSSTPNRIKVYEQKNAIKHSCSIGNYYISSDRFQLLKAFEVCPLDYIVSCAGTIGEIYKMPAKIEKGIINQALMKITLINENISIMFETILFVALRALSGSSKGTAIKNIAPFDKLKPYLVKLPPLSEQTRIMKRFNTVQKLLDNC